MRDQRSFLSVPFKAPDSTPIQESRNREILFGQAELTVAKLERAGLLEVILGLLSWPRRIIFTRRLRRL